jgi:hypothetical protein
LTKQSQISQSFRYAHDGWAAALAGRSPTT